MIWKQLLSLLFEFLTYGVFVYSALLLLSYLLIALFSIGEIRKHMRKNVFTDYRAMASSPHVPSVSILAPAYNEGLNIVENVRSLLSIYYANLEVIIINDGSKDDSLDKLIKAYDLVKVDYFIHERLKTKPVRGIYKSRNNIFHKLIVIDKVNGGKADALNVGINISSNDYLVCIDVDCVLEQDALLKMMKPFMDQKEKRVIATGGVVRIANSCTIEDGRLVKVRLADDYLPRMQILEYIRAFILGRMAWTRLNGLMLISGAFGAFDKEIAVLAGGYDHNTVGEDMELVVRMRRYMEEKKEDYLVTYIPDPLCWTEAPASFKILGRQRNRWIRGTYETLKFHKIMFFNPRYRLLGMLSYPYWFFFELCAPVIELTGFISFVVFSVTGMMDWSFFFTYFLFIITFGYLYSSFAILMEVLTYNQYKRRIDTLRLMLTGLTEPFYYHPFVVYSAVRGLLDLFKKKKGWGEMTRQGLTQPAAVPAAAPVASAAATGPQPVAPPVQQVYQPASLLERKIVPAISRVVMYVVNGFREYLQHLLVLVLLLVVLRGIELGADYSRHGAAPETGKVLLFGLIRDLSFLLHIALWGFTVYLLFFWLGRKTANGIFIAIASLFLLIQAALSQYFIKTLVPLGADLWAYSIADIKQTLGASGSINAGAVAGLVLLLLLFVFVFVRLGKRIRLGGYTAFFIFILLTITAFSSVTELTEDLKPGPEYSNNLAMNKGRYFWEKSYRYFFPPSTETDIYADVYSGDYQLEDKAAVQFIYPDEKNYPFLHLRDTADVLSPFLKKDTTLPNIVILLVEGLGRAFTNEGAYLGNFTPFIDSLSKQSLYWENFLSEGGRTFAVLPSLLGSLPFAKNGFTELGEAMPAHLSLLNILQQNGYQTSFHYGGESRFDNMDLYLQKNGVSRIADGKSFEPGYTKMPSTNGFTWGYGDKELFRHFLQTTPSVKRPNLSVALTVSTHDPFRINEQEVYLRRFEQRMQELGFSEDEKSQHRKYQYQFASILYADDAIQQFIHQYQQRPDFANTVFLITGDHRMPEIPMSTKLDRYHVPLILYSPLQLRHATFSSISTHFDIMPSLLSWLHNRNGIALPSAVNWIGSGLDTARSFRNIHAYPLMQTKNDLIDYVAGEYMLNGEDLYRISPTMGLTSDPDKAAKDRLRGGFDQFLIRNRRFLENPAGRLVPDSLLKKFTVARP
jgi:cellulose synthase/poly-beta-1,6-N-acetylglucosamine synthase-like glycosyltransferase/phosphoglycerol transferase MdoB-like AlkP superfamily enzyme